MGDLAGRRARVTVGAPGEGAKVLDSGVSPERGLRIAFVVEKTLKSSLNEAQIRAWKLSETTRGRIRADRSRFLLEAGYHSRTSGVDAFLHTLFRGQVTDAVTEREGPDLVTTIECRDGYDAVQEAELSIDRLGGPEALTFQAGTTVDRVIRTIASFFTLGGDVVFGDVDAALTRILANAFVRGQQTVLKRRRVIEGRAADWLDKIGRMYRFDWSIQDGVLELHLWDDIWRGDYVTVTADTGLIGHPSRIHPATKADGEVTVADGVRFRSLLRPQIRPGALVDIESEAVNGAFRVETARYEGDTSYGAWEVEAEAFAVPGLVEAIEAAS